MKHYVLLLSQGQWKLQNEDPKKATVSFAKASFQSSVEMASRMLRGSDSILKIIPPSGSVQELSFPKPVNPAATKAQEVQAR